MDSEVIIPDLLKIVNNETGEIETRAVSIVQNRKRNYNIKRSWNRMYKLGYDEVVVNLTKSELIIFQNIRDSNYKGSFKLNLNQTQLAKDLNMSYKRVAKVVRKMKDTNFIKKFDKSFRINPFIYIPEYLSNETVEAEQQLWKESEEEK